MSKPTTFEALMSSLPLSVEGSDAGAPEWIQILPATQGALETYDKRGPYRVDDIDAVIAASFANARNGKIPVDQDHAIAKAAPQGNPAPSRGWITEMQARDDGLYAKVKWTKAGAELVADGAYGGVSPVLMHTKDKRIVSIREVSLVNRENLRGLAALQSEEDSEMLEELIKMLELDEGATEEQVMSAIKAMKKKPEAAEMSEDLGKIAKALDLDEGTDAEKIVEAAQAAQTAVTASTDTEKLVTSLQAEVVVLRDKDKERDAQAAIAAERAKGKGIGAATEKVLVSLHMEGKMDAFNEMVAAQSDLSTTHTTDTPSGLQAGAQSAEEIGVKAKAHMKKAADEGRVITSAQAVQEVMEADQ